jgi:hypothetical protein
MGAVPVVAVEKSSTAVRASAEVIADELAWCLSRFLDATADESVMQRAKACLVLWQALRESDRREIDLTLMHH